MTLNIMQQNQTLEYVVTEVIEKVTPILKDEKTRHRPGPRRHPVTTFGRGAGLFLPEKFRSAMWKRV